jgi:DNA invertase Pin-like site-specific DNA recombinase
MTTTRRRARAGRRTVAIAYIRVSTDEQHLGPEAQRSAIAAHAKRHGIEIAAWHEDLGVSGGADIESCPGLLAAVTALRSAKAGVLLVAKRDRLARDVVKAALIERLVENGGAVVVSTAGEGSGDSPTDQLMRRIVDAFAEYERLVIKARTKAALAVKRDRGQRISLHAPYGYRFEAGRVVEDQGEQRVIARARALRGDGWTLEAIADELEVEGLANRNGKRFGLSALHKMLARPTDAAPAAA